MRSKSSYAGVDLRVRLKVGLITTSQAAQNAHFLPPPPPHQGYHAGGGVHTSYNFHQLTLSYGSSASNGQFRLYILQRCRMKTCDEQ